MTTVTAPATLTGTYAIDPTHSRIGFVARHAMVTKVRGSFNEFEGTGYFDAENPANSHLQLTIKAASIDTRNADRDGHLQEQRLLRHGDLPGDHASPPPPSSRSTTSNYRVTGDLTIKGVTKPVTVDFEYTGTAVDPYGNPGSASKARPPSTARTGASTGTPPSKPAACSSARR